MRKIMIPAINGPTTGTKLVAPANNPKDKGYLVLKIKNARYEINPTNKDPRILEKNQPLTLVWHLCQRERIYASYFLGKSKLKLFSIGFSSKDRKTAMLKTNKVENMPPKITKKAFKILAAIFSMCPLKRLIKFSKFSKAGIPKPLKEGEIFSKYWGKTLEKLEISETKTKLVE